MEVIHACERALGQVLLPCMASQVKRIEINEPSHSALEEAGMQNPCQSRLNEFRAGRRCARKALGVFMVTAEDTLLPKLGNGLVSWPDGYLGSISHSKGLCAAVVAQTEDVRCVGLDIERTDRLSEAATERVVHEDERSYIKTDSRMSSLLFSAKEAVFKAQYPCWHVPLNFHDMVMEISTEENSISVGLNENIANKPLVAALATMEIRYQFFDSFVVSLCYLNKQ